MNTDNVATQLEAMLPKSLGDIIRINRDQARLYLTTDQEVLDLYSELRPGRPKEIIDDWRFITLYVVSAGEAQVMLLGYKRCNGHARITSMVRKIDLDRGLVFTNSGSLYQLGTRGQGEPPFIHLAMICSAFHDWGFGRAFGVPHFFF